jgi:hypothetical protein
MLVCSSLEAQLTLPSLETRHLQVVYVNPEHYSLVPHLASCYENTFSFYNRLFGFSPRERTSVLFHDFTDVGYAGANNIPQNSIIVAIEPFDYNFDVMPANERMNWLMNHESVHLVTCDKENSTDRFYRTLFSGKIVPEPSQPLSMLYSYLAAPRRYSPRWYHEGFAVFMETWTAGGLGRALGGYDEMVFRAMVRDSAYFYNAVGLESEGTTADFQVGMNSYLYGTRFVNYLAATYGTGKLIDWFVRSDSSDRSFSTQFKRVYGLPLSESWDNWIEYEHVWQKENLTRLRAWPITAYRRICKEPLGSVSREFVDKKRGKMYCALNRPGRFAQIASIDLVTGEIEKLCDMPSPALMYVASLAYDDSSGTIFYTTSNTQYWRSLNALDIKTGDTRVVLAHARIGDLAFNRFDKSLWGVQHNNGRSILVRIKPPYDQWESMYLFPYSQGIIDIDIAPDGANLIGTSIEPSGKQTLVRVSIPELVRGSWNPEALHTFDNNSSMNFAYSPDGKRLYGTSYYTGVSNVWRYDFAARKMDLVSNTETGLFRPIAYGADSVIAFAYSGRGFEPVMLRDTTREDANPVRYLGQSVVEKYPVVKTWKLGSPANVMIDSLTTYKGDYNIIGSQHVSSMIPIIEGYDVFPAYGLRMSLHDPLMLGTCDITASWSPNKLIPVRQRLHASMALRYWQWGFEATWNRADFYDLFGPTRTSRAGYSMMLSYNELLINEPPGKMEYLIRAAMYGDLDRLPEYQNIAASFDKYIMIGADLKSSYLRKSLGGVDYEAGNSWQLSARNSLVNGTHYPRVFGWFDVGALTPWDHSSLWLRCSAGRSFGERKSSFANFYFGGFGNNWIDWRNPQRFREYSSFPGVDIDAIGGMDFAKALLEWTLPALKFREIGAMDFYVNWARLSFFSSGLVSDIGNAPSRNFYADAGAQLDFKVVMFSTLESTISFGYAVAYDRTHFLGDELVASLKILR